MDKEKELLSLKEEKSSDEVLRQESKRLGPPVGHKARLARSLKK